MQKWRAIRLLISVCRPSIGIGTDKATGKANNLSDLQIIY